MSCHVAVNATCLFIYLTKGKRGIFYKNGIFYFVSIRIIIGREFVLNVFTVIRDSLEENSLDTMKNVVCLEIQFVKQ